VNPFDFAFDRTMDFEGRVTHLDKDDPGGQTCWGISRNAFPHWAGWKLVDSRETHIPEAIVKDFYKSVFWNRAKLDLFKWDEMKIQFFDANVMGTRAIHVLQGLVGAEVDGIMGLKTVDAVNMQDGDSLVDKFLTRRAAFYEDRIKASPVMVKYRKGWLKRCSRSEYKTA
jgi:lysozyme family protein